MLSLGCDQSRAFTECQRRIGGLLIEDQSETKPILLLVAVGHSVISTPRTSVIAVAGFRLKIMPENKKGLYYEEPQ